METTRTPDSQITPLLHHTIGDQCSDLKGRWVDEREYEDWSDYDALLRKLFEGVHVGIKVLTINKNFHVRWSFTDGYERVTKIGVSQVTTTRFGR
jgi:hypothetical protein